MSTYHADHLILCIQLPSSMSKQPHTIGATFVLIDPLPCLSKPDLVPELTTKRLRPQGSAPHIYDPLKQLCLKESVTVSSKRDMWTLDSFWVHFGPIWAHCVQRDQRDKRAHVVLERRSQWNSIYMDPVQKVLEKWYSRVLSHRNTIREPYAHFGLIVSRGTT